MKPIKVLLSLLATGALAGCKQPSSSCTPVPASSTFEISEAASNDTEQMAFVRASNCVHARAYEFARAESSDLARDAVMAACRAQVQHAQSRAYFFAVLSGASAPPPAGLELIAPACKNGEDECNPWERDWGDTAPSVGALVNQDGISASPQHHAGEAMAERVLQDLRGLAALRLVEAKLNNCKG